MSALSSASGRLPALSLLLALALGLVAGGAVLTVADMETRWIVYFCGGVGFLTLLLVLPKKQTVLWVTFVLGLQFHLSLRLIYGYRGSEGIELSFYGLLGLFFLICYLFTKTEHETLRGLGPARLPLLVMLAAFVVSSLQALSPFIAFTSVIIYLQFYLLFFLGMNYPTRQERLDLTLKLLLSIVVLQSLVYYVQSALGISFTLVGRVEQQGALPRPGGTVAGGSPAGFAIYMFPLVLIAIAHTLSYRRTWRARIWIGVIAVMGSAAIVLTFTRAAWAALALGVAWICLCGLKKGIIRLRMVLPAAIAGLIVAVLLVPFVFTARTDNPLDHAFEGRMALNRIALRVIENYPLTGVGPGGYSYHYENYVTNELSQYWLYTVHNTYLLMTAELGVLGGLALVLWLGCGIALGLRMANSPLPQTQATGLGISAGFVALAFELLWEPKNGFNGMTPLAIYWFLLGLAAARPWARDSAGQGDKT